MIWSNLVVQKIHSTNLEIRHNNYVLITNVNNNSSHYIGYTNTIETLYSMHYHAPARGALYIYSNTKKKELYIHTQINTLVKLK